MNINFKKNKPFFEEVSIEDIVNSNATPFYLYSQKIINETYNELINNLSAEIFYAIKANSNQAILTLMKNCGAGADVVSAGELQRSLTAGFSPNKIIFEGVGKSKEDIEYAINQNIRMINAESINEILLINEIARKLNRQINIGVRLNPNIDGKTLNKISTGKSTDKFGIGIQNIFEIITLIKSLNNIKLNGISCHIGSQISDISIFEKVFTEMKNTAEIIISNGIKIEHLDLGGGFNVNYEHDNNNFDINSIGKLVNSIFKNTSYKISFEPGRYLIAKAGIVITKILTVKENGGINFLITDAGMQTLIRPAMYNAFHRIDALNDLDKENKLYNIAGPICESSDILATKVELPEQKAENFLAIYDTGAYGASMASNYNSRGIPAEILVNENKFSIIHKQEKIKDIIKRDSIPDWLN